MWAVRHPLYCYRATDLASTSSVGRAETSVLSGPRNQSGMASGAAPGGGLCREQRARLSPPNLLARMAVPQRLAALAGWPLPHAASRAGPPPMVMIAPGQMAVLVAQGQRHVASRAMPIDQLWELLYRSAHQAHDGVSGVESGVASTDALRSASQEGVSSAPGAGGAASTDALRSASQEGVSSAPDAGGAASTDALRSASQEGVSSAPDAGGAASADALRSAPSQEGVSSAPGAAGAAPTDALKSASQEGVSSAGASGTGALAMHRFERQANRAGGAVGADHAAMVEVADYRRLNRGSPRTLQNL